MRHFEPLEPRQLLASVPSGFSDARLTSGIVQGTAMALAPDGRLFVAEQKDSIRLIKNGALLSSNFATLSTKIEGSRGLIGIAVDPSYSTNKYLYVYYTVFGTTVKNRLARLTANGDVVKSGSEKVLWETPALNTVNHNGGAIEFGKDGKLYLATGDDFTTGNAQSLSSPLGKILRFNKDGTIPTDNPFYSSASGSNRAIWARGLRNPYTFGIHRGSGKMFINDVGDAAFEEINEGKKGHNYGWDTYEGPANQSGLTDPYYYYAHDIGSSVIAAAFYNPATVKFPASYKDDYFFGDYVAGFIKTLDYSGASPAVTTFATGITQLVDMEVASDGTLYYLQRGNSKGTGAVSKITYVNSGTKPAITENPASQTVAAARSVTFEVSASGTAPLTYQWQRDGANISGATASSYILGSVNLSDDGAQFRCIVTNSAGSATSNSATLSVVDDKPPVPTITLPPENQLYRGGMEISYSGAATDPEDGVLASGRFEWEIIFHHATHTHPFAGPIVGSKSGAFVIPVADEPDTNQWYRIQLTVTDSIGNQTTVFRDIRPDVTTISLTSNIPGIPLQLDGDVVAHGQPFDSLIGGQRRLSAPLEHAIGEDIYDFVGWSDGKAAIHDIITPAAAAGYTATYALRPPAVKNIDATYYNNSDFTGAVVSRKESEIHFHWVYGSPDPSLAADTWSARWTSHLIAPLTGPVTLHTSTDDGVRLWIDGQLVIDKWINQSQKEYTATIEMEAGRKYSFKMEYYDNGGKATAELYWSGAGLAKQSVPAAAFSLEGNPSGPTDPPPPPDPTPNPDPSPGEVATLGASADVTVRGGTYASSNFGSASTVEVKSDLASAPNFQREGLLRFDLGSIGQEIVDGRLRLNGRLNSTENASVAVEVFAVLGNWNESNVTWNTRPAADVVSLGTINVAGTANRWYEVDLTNLLKAAQSSGQTQVNLILKAPLVTKARAMFSSRESGSMGPQLQITTATPPLEQGNRV